MAERHDHPSNAITAATTPTTAHIRPECHVPAAGAGNRARSGSAPAERPDHRNRIMPSSRPSTPRSSNRAGRPSPGGRRCAAAGGHRHGRSARDSLRRDQAQDLAPDGRSRPAARGSRRRRDLGGGAVGGVMAVTFPPMAGPGRDAERPGSSGLRGACGGGSAGHGHGVGTRRKSPLIGQGSVPPVVRRQQARGEPERAAVLSGARRCFVHDERVFELPRPLRSARTARGRRCWRPQPAARERSRTTVAADHRGRGRFGQDEGADPPHRLAARRAQGVHPASSFDHLHQQAAAEMKSGSTRWSGGPTRCGCHFHSSACASCRREASRGVARVLRLRRRRHRRLVGLVARDLEWTKKFAPGDRRPDLHRKTSAHADDAAGGQQRVRAAGGRGLRRLPDRLRTANAFDFDDLIMETVSAAAADAVAEYYRRRSGTCWSRVPGHQPRAVRAESGDGAPPSRARSRPSSAWSATPTSVYAFRGASIATSSSSSRTSLAAHHPARAELPLHQTILRGRTGDRAQPGRRTSGCGRAGRGRRSSVRRRQRARRGAFVAQEIDG